MLYISKVLCRFVVLENCKMSVSAISELEKLKSDLLNEVNALSITIELLRSKLPKTIETDLAIKKREDKIAVITSSSINETINNMQNDNSAVVLRTIADAKRFVKKSFITKELAFLGLSDDSIRSAITYLKKRGLITSYKATPNNSDTFWGLSEWVENGSIVDQYNYYENELVYKR